MYLKFIKEFIYNEITFEKETTYLIKDIMLARYLIRKQIAVEEK